VEHLKYDEKRPDREKSRAYSLSVSSKLCFSITVFT
jgi:hypothetical protein